MNQRDRIAIAMMAPDMPPPPIHNPRNLLRGAPAPEEGISQEMIDAMGRKSQGLVGEPGYAEWDTLPSSSPPLVEQGQPPPLPPEVIPPDAPDWATTQQGTPEFIEYPMIHGKYRDT